MAGKIIADQIEHSTAGSLDTQYVVNGSAKAWVNFNGTGTIATRDSLNVSGLVDDSTGAYTINFSPSMGNANFAMPSSNAEDDTQASTGGFLNGRHTNNATTSSFSMQPNKDASNNLLDGAINTAAIFGDLA